jgi:peptidoglycan/LPS O-acetylase OafA/YrhL
MILTMGSADTASGAFNFVLLILLAIALARRFRDIGWPAWIGPTILLGTMFGLPFIALFYVMTMRYVDDHLMHAIAHLVALVLLVVAGSVPGKTASSTETVQAFE